MRIEPFDPGTAGDGDLRAQFELAAEVYAERRPEGPGLLFDEYIQALTPERPWEHSERLAAWDDERRTLLGSATAMWEEREDNRHLGGFDMCVRRDARRRGVARALLAPVLDILEREGRTVAFADADEDGPGERFLTAMGMAPKLRERVSRCRVADIDRQLLETWVKQAEDAATGYTMLTWTGPTPPELLDAFVDVYQTVNTAPHEDFEMEDEVITAAMIRAKEQTIVLRTPTWFTAAVRHDASGDLVAFTQLGLQRWHPEVVEQWWTATRPEHRGRGLGRWVKAVNALRLLDEHPQAQWIDTGNAGSNRSMLGINDEMGFRPLRFVVLYQAPISAVRERLG